ncbi:hypothetical protein TWF225_010386 [Orbilia oligospora]|nr:hypothetical protein TWF225_010386 [Orbilia oligospora]KAF3243734.1 hypothetical protein TWF128_009933 [Orbilia oligospora]KAF3250515.1 hypothetical protein TWF217_008557 [Orbilia oligospora]KAF3294868.1 hypothetical protein TWF132_002789 [Orbilia oligospora]
MAHSGYHARIGAAAQIPINDSTPIISFSPVVLPAPKRLFDLELRVTFPATGNDTLPILLLSHGQGASNYLSSLEGYAPLAEFYAAHGFAVLQPTHLRSGFLGGGLPWPQGDEMWWKGGAGDMVQILDSLDTIESTVPSLKGRLDHTKISVVGHSAGSLTVYGLLGFSNTDPRDGSVYYQPDNRVKVGVILAGIGGSGENLSENGKGMIPFYGAEFSKMSTPALVVYGDDDASPHLTTRGADWHADPYHEAPGPKDLLTLFGAKHGLGGISGWDAGETLDESPELLGIVQRMTWAYLRSQLFEGDTAWEDACKALVEIGKGKVERKE